MPLGSAFGTGFASGSQAVSSGLALKQKEEELAQQKQQQMVKDHQGRITTTIKAYDDAIKGIYAKSPNPEEDIQKFKASSEGLTKGLLQADKLLGGNPEVTSQMINNVFSQPSPAQLAEQEAQKAGTIESAKGEAKGATKTIEKDGVFKMVRSTDKEALDALIKEGWVERTASDVSGEESALSKFLSKSLAKQVVENRQTAIKASDSIRTANEAIKLLDEGVVTGFGADIIVNMGRVAKRLGFDVGTNVENTQAFAANQGKAVLDILGSGALGAGTGISDNDRLFAKQIAAGDVSLDEKAIRRIVELNAKVSSNVIDRHNKEAADIGDSSPINLKVEKPEFKSGIPSPKTPEDYNAIPSGSEYISLDGKRYRKP
jgi:hypothetical protein